MVNLKWKEEHPKIIREKLCKIEDEVHFISLTDASKSKASQSKEEDKTSETISREMENWSVELEKEYLKLKKQFIATIECNLPEKRSGP